MGKVRPAIRLNDGKLVVTSEGWLVQPCAKWAYREEFAGIQAGIDVGPVSFRLNAWQWMTTTIDLTDQSHGEDRPEPFPISYSRSGTRYWRDDHGTLQEGLMFENGQVIAEKVSCTNSHLVMQFGENSRSRFLVQVSAYGELSGSRSYPWGQTDELVGHGTVFLGYAVFDCNVEIGQIEVLPDGTRVASYPKTIVVSADSGPVPSDGASIYDPGGRGDSYSSSPQTVFSIQPVTSRNRYVANMEEFAQYDDPMEYKRELIRL